MLGEEEGCQEKSCCFNQNNTAFSTAWWQNTLNKQM